jgi:intracellular septation protein A
MTKQIIQFFGADTPAPINIDNTLSPLPKPAANQSNIDAVLSVVFGTMAVVAILIIVIAGLRYILANGDAQAMSKAKNTIIYALIGLVIAMSGFSIVTFVLKGVS